MRKLPWLVRATSKRIFAKLFHVPKKSAADIGPSDRSMYHLAHQKAELFSRHLSSTYGDQKGQVAYLINNVFDYQHNGLPHCGFFVDLACGDGVEISNTYFLESHLGWTGILIEPNPEFAEQVKRVRSSRLVQSVVSDVEGAVVKFRVDNGLLGGIVAPNTDNNETTRGEELLSAQIIEMRTRTLAGILDEFEAPRKIDFLSLDVEGAEELVLANFPFDEYQFRCIAVERPSPTLDILLDKNGYRQVAHLHYDVIYVHGEHLDGVNFSPSTSFAFTPRKDW